MENSDKTKTRKRKETKYEWIFNKIKSKIFKKKKKKSKRFYLN